MTQFTSKGVKQINNRISLNMTFTFTICISLHFSSVREFQMGNFQKYWSQNVGQDFIVLDFFHGRNILKVDGRDGRDPQNLEKNASRRFTCMCEATECRAHVLICVATEYIVHVLICEATECRECVNMWSYWMQSTYINMWSYWRHGMCISMWSYWMQRTCVNILT
jgi:hypothetical protein